MFGTPKECPSWRYDWMIRLEDPFIACFLDEYVAPRIRLCVLSKGINPTVLLLGMGCLDHQSYS